MKKPYSEQESLARSHDAGSNAKLTLIVLFGAFCFAAFFGALGLYGARGTVPFLVAAICAGALGVLDLFAVRRFRR